MKIHFPKIVTHQKTSAVHIKEKKYRKLNPTNAWHKLLIVAFVLLFVSVLVHVHLYKQIEQDTAVALSGDGGVEQIDEKKLEAVLDYFVLKEIEFQKTAQEVQPVLDPSL